MARISNLLTGNTAAPVDGFGLWTVTNATPFIQTEGVPINVTTMMLLRPNNSVDDVVLSLNGFEVPAQYRADSVDFGFYIRSDAKIEVEIQAQNDAASSALDEPFAYISQTKTVVPAKGSWVFPRVNRISTGIKEIPQFISVTITVSNHGGSNILFARPVIVPTFYHLDDNPTEVVLSYIPDEWIDDDNLSTGVVAGMSKLLHVMTVAYQDAHDLHVKIKNLDHIDSYNDDVPEFASTLVNPDYLDKTYARWLAQFTGSVLVDPSAGLTPWANLPKVWSQWTSIDSIDPGVDVDWSEVEGFNIELIGVEEYFRWQIQTQAYSSKGGTYDAMTSAAQRVLSGTKTVNITHSTTEEWTILVRTIEAETSPLLLASAMYASKPAGFALVINDPYLS